MTDRIWNVYLSGEIHSDWREQIEQGIAKEKLPVRLSSPVCVHEDSDKCGVTIFGAEEKSFWMDQKGSKLNAIRTRTLIEEADLVIVRFGEKYKQWNAAFDAGYAAALGKPYITLHPKQHDHALKEVDGSAQAMARDPLQVVQALNYIINGKLP